MNCEICGTEIKGQPYKTKIDNSLMVTCKEGSRKSKEEEYELVDDYEKTIKQAREKKNLTHKQLGEKIYERESVIANIETGKMVPDNKIAHKLEKALHIKIIEKIESNEREFQESRRFKEATLGDIARIKRK